MCGSCKRGAKSGCRFFANNPATTKSDLAVKSIFRLPAQSLISQIIWTVAIGLFIGQAVNFYLIQRESEKAIIAGTAAAAVVRIQDSLDRGPNDARSAPPSKSGGSFSSSDSPRVTISNAPTTRGNRNSAIEHRIKEMFEERDPRAPLAVVAREHMEWRLARLLKAREAPRLVPEQRLTVSVEIERGKWATVEVRGINRGPTLNSWWLYLQTPILYLFTLLPLLLVGWRLARPLKDLTVSARRFADTGSADPVTERGPGDVRQLTTAFNAMRSRLLAMLDEKDRMLGAIGHDMRTPLASLRVRAESIDDEAERNRVIETIVEMNEMLDDILSLARAGRSTETPQKTDVAALADAVVEDFIELGKPVTISEGVRQVTMARPQMLRRALRNLIENAIKYGARAEIGVGRNVKGEIVISVADSGPGIAPERMAEMMEPFTRMEGSRSRGTGGAGLGLALVRAIMEEHGGQLQLANRPEGGLVARLILPG